MNENICGICSDVINNNIILSCNHNFCYDCIYKWFEFNNTYITRCPYCKKKIKKIPVLYDYKFNHKFNLKCETNSDSKLNSNNNNINLITCNALLKSSKLPCKNKGKECYGYYCGIHKKFNITNPKNNIN